MSEHPTATLVISDGGLPALVAAAIEAERRVAAGGGEACLMPWPSHDDLAPAQFTAIASAARALDLRIVEPLLPAPAAGLSLPPSVRDSLCLLSALHTAAAAGYQRVVWPVHHHNDDMSITTDLDRIAADIDRAQLIGRLGLLEPSGASPPTIDTPLVDLTDAQLADLVVDLDAPVYLSWWWRPLGDHPAEAGAAIERRAWLPVLRDAGWTEAGPAPRVAREADRSPSSR